MHPQHSSVAHEAGAGTPALPALEPGCRLLDAAESTPTTRTVSTPIIHTLVVDHLLLHGGTVQWVDAGRHASTTPLAQLVPSERTLDRINIARAFTPYQHARLLEQLAEQIDDTTSLVVCPVLDQPYRADECSQEGDALLLKGLARLSSIARAREVPILLTRSVHDEFSAPLVEAAVERIEYRQTDHGPRFVGDQFKTLTYPAGGGLVQTTLEFWRQMIDARRPLYDAAATGLMGEA